MIRALVDSRTRTTASSCSAWQLFLFIVGHDLVSSNLPVEAYPDVANN